MSPQSLYASLGRRTAKSAGPDHGRTERTATRETIDNDRAQSSLYSQLGVDAFGGNGDRGRTEETKAGGETVDRDRHVPRDFSALLAGTDDLYLTLGTPSGATGEEGRGRTAITESTESIDWDRPPIGPWK